jgi:hypothetical protein
VTSSGASRRQAIYEWAKGDPALLSALVVKAEEALESTRRVLLDVEGSLLAYWTDIPQTEIQRLLPLIRETLGDYEPKAAA